MEVNRSAFYKKKAKEHIERALQLYKRINENEVIVDALAMHCFQAINYTLDLIEHITNTKNLGIAFSYSDYVDVIESKGIISKKDAETLKRFIFLRNKIAHEYHIFSKEDIIEIAKNIKKLENIVEKLR